MKIIPIYKSDQKLIEQVQAHKASAQRALFDSFSPKMLSVCRQYISDFQQAEDVMLQGFTKAFKAINRFDSKRPFMPWIKRIMINECISHLRKNKNFEVENPNPELLESYEDGSNNQSEYDAIQYYIDQLPEGYKMVFMLYVVDGYKHREIAEMLKISEGTSKSQLHKARNILQARIKESKKLSHE